MISIDALSSHVQSMYEEGFLELDMLQGSVVSDRVVRERVDSLAWPNGTLFHDPHQKHGERCQFSFSGFDIY